MSRISVSRSRRRWRGVLAILAIAALAVLASGGLQMLAARNSANVGQAQERPGVVAVPTEGVDPGPGRAAVAISARVADFDCGGEWQFAITGIADGAQAPASIQVAWESGAKESVKLSGMKGETALYSTSSNSDSTVVSAGTKIYGGWDGSFELI